MPKPKPPVTCSGPYCGSIKLRPITTPLGPSAAFCSFGCWKFSSDLVRAKHTETSAQG